MFEIIKLTQQTSIGYSYPYYALRKSGHIFSHVYVKKTEGDYPYFELDASDEDTVSQLVKYPLSEFPEETELRLPWKFVEGFSFSVKISVLHHSLYKLKNVEESVFNFYISVIPNLVAWKYPFSFTEYFVKFKEVFNQDISLKERFHFENFLMLPASSITLFTHHHFSPQTIAEEVNPFIDSIHDLHKQVIEFFVPEENVEDKHDVFISYASEDKDSFVRPLAEKLRERGFNVWFDEFQLKVGDKLRRSIDKGLANSKKGIVVLSNNFFNKNWPQYELDGLTQREMTGEKVILPIWHNISKNEVLKYSVPLADTVALVTETSSLEDIADKISEVLK